MIERVSVVEQEDPIGVVVAEQLVGNTCVPLIRIQSEMHLKSETLFPIRSFVSAGHPDGKVESDRSDISLAHQLLHIQDISALFKRSSA